MVSFDIFDKINAPDVGTFVKTMETKGEKMRLTYSWTPLYTRRTPLYSICTSLVLRSTAVPLFPPWWKRNIFKKSETTENPSETDFFCYFLFFSEFDSGRVGLRKWYLTSGRVGSGYGRLGLGRVGSGRARSRYARVEAGSGQVMFSSGRVGSQKIDPCRTLVLPLLGG